jgi:uncharacterized membrane protein YgdD (TMEM256/DUF423 family)
MEVNKMRWAIVFAGIGGAIMVAVAAYASHAALGEQARSWLQTGAQFGLWHSLALLGVAAISARRPSSWWLTLAAIAFAAGIVLFSGTLFARAATSFHWLSKATPLGGLSFIAGWLVLALYGIAGRRD